MKRFRFPIAVAVTSLVLVAVISAAIVFMTPIGAIAAQSAFGSPPWMGGMGFGPHGFGPLGSQLPPELQGLGNLPPAERFDHFVGVQVNLKDKDNRPFTVSITPGAVTTSSASNLTIAANDGTSKTFTLDSNTVIHGKQAPGGSQAAPQSLTSGDKVIVITTSGGQTAMAVIDAGNGDFAAAGGFAGPPWAHWGHAGPQQ